MVELNREYLVRIYGKEDLLNLTEIDLSKIGIKKIDSNTFINLTKLETLLLGQNEIEEIDSKLLESLSNLNRLNLSNIWTN